MLSLAERYGIEYLGIDCRTDLQPFKEMLSSQASCPARLEISCLSRLPQHLGPEHLARKECILCVFPFNLIGNIGDFGRILRGYASAGLDILLSSFNCASFTTEARYQYYLRCNIRNVTSIYTAEGVLFTDFQEFFSFSSYENTLHTLLALNGYSVVQAENLQTNLFLHCQPHARARANEMGRTGACLRKSDRFGMS